MPEIVFLTSEKNMPLPQTLYHITHPLLGRLKQKKQLKPTSSGADKINVLLLVCARNCFARFSLPFNL